MESDGVTIERFGTGRVDPLISIIIPTINGREHWLEQCRFSYMLTGPSNYELIIVRDRQTCGIAWNDGFDASRGRYIHFTADDIEAHPGWWEAAREICDKGLLPAPRLLNSDGSLQACGDVDFERPDGVAVSFTRVPFLSRAQKEQIGPIIDTHYSTDVWVSEIARLHGVQTVFSWGYVLTHHYAPEGRVDHRLEDDREQTRIFYEAYRVNRGLEYPHKLWEECAPQ